MTNSEPPAPLQPAPQTPYPTSAAPYPVSSSPYGLVPPPGRPRLSPWIWVLTGVSGLLVVAAGGLGFLYMDARAANDKQIAERTTQIDELTTKVDELEQAGEGLDRESHDVQADLDASEATLDGLSPCPDALNALLLTDPDTSAFEDAVLAMVDACDADI